jgi:hypothetical protein
MSHDEVSATEHVLLISGGPSEPPVPVVLEAYQRFGRQMDVQLERLVAIWSHAAAPLARSSAATPARRTSFDSPKPR